MDTIHHTAESDHLGNRVEDFGSANQSLRRGDLKNGNDDPVGVITQLKSFMRSFSTGLGAIQGSYNNGDFEGAGKSLRDVVGDADSFVKTANDLKQLENIEGLPEAPFDNLAQSDGIQTLIPEDISNSMLGNHMHPEIIEKLAEFSIELTNNLEDIDLSLLAKAAASSKKKSNIKGSKLSRNKSKPGLKKDFKPPHVFKADSNQFSSSNVDEMYANFMKNPNMQSINKQTRFQRKGVSLPKISTFVSVRDQASVMLKHQLRQEAMDVCLPECSESDMACNCAKLFGCVQQLNEYDLAV